VIDPAASNVDDDGVRDETLDSNVELDLSVEDCYRHLRELAWNCISLVASSVGLSHSAATALLEGHTTQALPSEKGVPDAAVSLGRHSTSNAPSLSASNLTGINYGVADGCLTQSAHCPFHTDKCLVTIIPLARTGSDNQAGDGMQAGLRVFDWHAQCWVDVETRAPQPGTTNRQFALVFGGESLARATNGFIQPAVHEVLQPKSGVSIAKDLEAAASGEVPPFRRLSTPFQAFAPPDAVFDCGALEPKAVGEIPPRYACPVNALAFLSQLSQGMLSCY
jgi:hypothetical protein